MKIKKLLTATTCAALIAAAALPLTACGGAKNFKEVKDGSELDMSKYAQELKELPQKDYSSSSVSKVTVTASGLKTATATDSRKYIIATKESGDPATTTYSAYSGQTGKLIVENLVYEPQEDYNYMLLVSGKDSDDKSVYALYGEDGTKLIENSYSQIGSPFHDTVKRVKCYIDGEAETVLKLTGTKADGTKFSNYFAYETDAFFNTTYTSVNEADIKYVAPDLSVGSDKFAVAKPIYNDPEKPVEGEIASYSYSVIADEYVFTKGGEETGRVSADNIDKHAFVGDYMYYTVKTELPENDKKANLVMPEDDTENKYNYEFHKYDIVKNKDSKLDYSYYIEGINPLYNSEKKAFDAAIIGGSKIINKTRQLNAPFAYVVTSELELAYDVTPLTEDMNYEVDFQDYLYKLDDNKLLAYTPDAIVIMNEKLELVSSVPNSYFKGYYSAEKLMLLNMGTNSNPLYSLVDYDGKIVAAPQYMYIGTFCGSKAIAYKTDTTAVILTADGTETALPEESQEVNDNKAVEVSVTPSSAGWYQVKTTTTTLDPTTHMPTEETVTNEFFNYDGTSLNAYVDCEVDIVGSAIIVTETDDQDNSTCTISVIE